MKLCLIFLFLIYLINSTIILGGGIELSPPRRFLETKKNRNLVLNNKVSDQSKLRNLREKYNNNINEKQNLKSNN